MFSADVEFSSLPDKFSPTGTQQKGGREQLIAFQQDIFPAERRSGQSAPSRKSSKNWRVVILRMTDK